MIISERERWVNFAGMMSVEGVAGLIMGISNLEMKDPAKPITLFITSDGGSVRAGVAFYEFVRRILEVKLQTVVLGNAASMAVIMFLAGEERIITKGSTLLLHDLSSLFKGDTDYGKEGLQREYLEISAHHKRYVQTVVERSGGKISAKEVSKLMRERTVLSAKEAVKLGIAHRVKN